MDTGLRDYAQGIGSILNIMPANLPFTLTRSATMDETAQMAAAWRQTGDDLHKTLTEYSREQPPR